MKNLIFIFIFLTGFIAFCDIKDGFKVLKTIKIAVQSKNHNLSIKKETKSIIKNQVDFSANYSNILEEIYEENNVGLFEQITTRPFNSTVSSMSLSDTSAVFRCIFESLDIPYKIVPPKNWKGFLGLSSNKEESRELFNKLINNNEIIINFKKNIKNHNEIEAILIAYYFYKINKKASI